VENFPDDRSPLAVAMEWVSRITTISLEMVLPALAGYWVDERLGTRFVLVVGVVVGFSVGMWHLVKLTKAPPGGSPPPRGPAEND
jgi:ATP synthase protein I